MMNILSSTRLTLLNTSILTAYGEYRYELLKLDDARSLVREFQRAGKQIQSAIGHQSTAELISTLLDFPVPAVRKEFTQVVGDVALVFKLKQRPPEGVILSREELEAIGYEFGILVRTA